MRISSLSKFIPLLVLALATLLSEGCSDGTAPAPISMDQIPAELGKAFASAKAETKELSDSAVTAVQGKDLAKALTVLQGLTQRADLSKSQSRVVAGATVTVNAALLESASKGDPGAIQTLDIRRKTK